MPDDAGVHTLISPPQTLGSTVAVRRHPRDQKYLFFLFALYVLFDPMDVDSATQSPPNIDV